MKAVVQRNPLGQQVYDILLDDIEQGRYEPDRHIAEAEVCSRLHVSRTPVREALFKLEQRGLVISRPNQGFFVAPNSRQQVIEHYPILGALEALALRSSPEWHNTDIRKLESINRRIIRKGAGPASRLKADQAFHEALVARCGNPSLVRMIDAARAEIRRWDGGARRGMVDPEKGYQEHAHIISGLDAGDPDVAARLLEAHWNSGIETVTKWIAEQESRDE